MRHTHVEEPIPVRDRIVHCPRDLVQPLSHDGRREREGERENERSGAGKHGAAVLPETNPLRGLLPGLNFFIPFRVPRTQARPTTARHAREVKELGDFRA